MPKHTAVIIIATIFIIVGLIVFGRYAAWYEWSRWTKIAHNVTCDRLGKSAHGSEYANALPPCAYEIVPPSLWEKITGARWGAQPIHPLSGGCNQSATTTDCSKSPIPSGESGYFFPATFYTEFASTSQSGKVDSHLTVDNTLIEVTFCGKIYRTRQIFIDGTDIVSRLAALANAGALPKDGEGRVGLCMSQPGEIHLRGIIGTEDVKSFDGNDVGLPGTTYLVIVAANAFDINPQTGNIYQTSGYDGSLSGPVGNLWATYTNDELGISFTYPPNSKADANQWHIGEGDTGRAFQASIGLPSGATIYVYAMTKEYSVPKGGLGVATEGFIVRDGRYYTIRRGEASEQSFTPDAIWALAGSSAVVQYGKNYDPAADYPEPPVRALVNLHGQEFTGIGFVLFNGVADQGTASPEDIEILKKVVTSIRFIK